MVERDGRTEDTVSSPWYARTRTCGATAGMWEEAEAAFAAAERRVNEEEHVRDRPHLNLWQGKMLLDRGRPRDRERGTTQIRAARDEFVTRGARYCSRLSEEILSRA